MNKEERDNINFDERGFDELEHRISDLVEDVVDEFWRITKQHFPECSVMKEKDTKALYEGFKANAKATFEAWYEINRPRTIEELRKEQIKLKQDIISAIDWTSKEELDECLDRLMELERSLTLREYNP